MNIREISRKLIYEGFNSYSPATIGNDVEEIKKVENSK